MPILKHLTCLTTVLEGALLVRPVLGEAFEEIREPVAVDDMDAPASEVAS